MILAIKSTFTALQILLMFFVGLSVKHKADRSIAIGVIVYLFLLTVVMWL